MRPGGFGGHMSTKSSKAQEALVTVVHDGSEQASSAGPRGRRPRQLRSLTQVQKKSSPTRKRSRIHRRKTHCPLKARQPSSEDLRGAVARNNEAFGTLGHLRHQRGILTRGNNLRVPLRLRRNGGHHRPWPPSSVFQAAAQQ